MSTEVTRTAENFKSIIETFSTNLNRLDKLEISIRGNISILRNDIPPVDAKEPTYTPDIMGEFMRLNDGFSILLERLERCNITLGTLV